MTETLTENPNKDPMVVADPLAVFAKDGMLKIIAPAKTNLYLDVGEVRADGFHEVKTIMHTLSLHDVLHMDYEKQVEDSGGLTIEIGMYGREGIDVPAIAAEENLVYKAIYALAQKLGRTENEKIKVRIEKHIPHQAGLGGGSSDAAAALIGAAHFWEIDKMAPEVIETAASLGSDIVFFLYGGCAYFTGKGEVFEKALKPMKKPIVLIRPEGSISTAEAYRVFDADFQSTPDNIVKEARMAQQAEEVGLYNNLTQAATKILPEVGVVESWGNMQEGIEQVLLSGSGSASVLLADTFDTACRVSSEAQKRGWWARVTTFSPLGAAIIPKR